MKEKKSDLQKRTKEYSLEIIKFYKELPKDFEVQHIGRQLFRSATSVGANTRAAFRGRSKKEFIAKLGIVIEEADESVFWLELLHEILEIKKEIINKLIKESEELLAIFVSISKKTKLSAF